MRTPGGVRALLGLLSMGLPDAVETQSECSAMDTSERDNDDDVHRVAAAALANIG